MYIYIPIIYIYIYTIYYILFGLPDYKYNNNNNI